MRRSKSERLMISASVTLMALSAIMLSQTCAKFAQAYSASHLKAYVERMLDKETR